MSHEDLGFLSGMHIKNKAVTHSCNRSPEEVETGWALRLTSQTTWANDMPWVLVNDPVSISTYWHLCAHPCTLVHAHMLGHVYTPPHTRTSSPNTHGEIITLCHGGFGKIGWVTCLQQAPGGTEVPAHGISVVTHISGNGSWRSRGVTWCFSSLQHGEALLRETIARQGIHSQTQVTSSAARRKCHREMQSLTWVLRSGDSSENRAWTFWLAEMPDSFKGMSNSQSPGMILRGWGKPHYLS